MLAVATMAGAARATSLQTLYTFAGGNDDGAWPAGNLVADKNGYLYGTTSTGGPNGAGTVFKLAPDGTETVLYHFTGGNDGNTPMAGLLMDSNGDLYGVTEIGGKFGEGNVFKLTPDGVETSIYDFGTHKSDGGNPICQLIWSRNHELLGTTVNAGAGTDGTVFRVSLTGKETILHAFTGIDGEYPRAGLVMDSAGNLYGTTFNSSGTATSGTGTAFEITAQGDFKELYAFVPASGYFPYAALTLDKSGNLYGTTTAGGAYNYGTVFKLTTSGSLTVLHSFTNGTDGASPEAPVFMTKSGDLWGTTASGGKADYGTIFRLRPDGTLTTLHAFTGSNGGFSQTGLIEDSAIGGGWLYGSTYAGGSGNGVLFRVQR